MDDEHLKSMLEFQRLAFTEGQMTLKTQSYLSEPQPNEFCNFPSLCTFIIQNFGSFKKMENLKSLLPLIHYTLGLEGKQSNNTNVNSFILKLMNEYKNEPQPTTLMTILQILYQIVKTCNESTCYIEDDFFYELIDVLDSSQNSVLNANILTCIKSYVQKFKTSALLRHVWTNLIVAKEHKSNTIPILIALFDEFVMYESDFHRNPKLIEIIQKLIFADLSEQRKSAYYLLSRSVECDSSRSAQQKLQWNVYITVLKNLEENQSHLILPSLEKLKDINFSSSNEEMQPWIDIIHTKMLEHNNILVTRWTIEYFLSKHSWTQLSTEILKKTLTTTNNTKLYNVESYVLPKQNIFKFLAHYSSVFLEAFADINWKSVPMHYWLQQLSLHNCTSLAASKGLVFKIAARVRVLQNPRIRNSAIKLFEHIFSDCIQRMQFADYVILIETLYNVIDGYSQHSTFATKFVDACECSTSRNVNLFSKRLYEILTNNAVTLNTTSMKSILNALQSIPKENHDWLRFLIVFDTPDFATVSEFCSTSYNIDVQLLNNASLNEILKEFNAKLVWHVTEVSYVHSRSIDFFVCQRLKHFNDLRNTEFSLKQILDAGTQQTLIKLSELLRNQDEPADYSDLLQIFLTSLTTFLKETKNFDCYNIIDNLLHYCKSTQTKAIQQEYAEKILAIDLENNAICEAVLKSGIILESTVYLRGLQLGVAKIGDARIEELYETEMLQQQPVILLTRQLYALYLPIGHFRGQNCDILNMLLQINNDISRKKPRHFENSHEHRLKLRVAAVFLQGIQVHTFWTNDLWQTIIEQNNQPNVKFIYEVIISVCAENLNTILEQIKQISKYTVSQQVSIVSVLNYYIHLKWHTISVSDCSCIINALMPLTMGAHFQSRLYAQLTIYNILKKSKEKLINIPNGTELQATLDAVLGDQIEELLLDVRMQLPNLYMETCGHKEFSFVELIMYVTNAPIDEYISTRDYKKFQYLKQRFSNRNQQASSNEAMVLGNVPHVINDVLQRKMNPVNEVLDKSNLISYPPTCQSELFVVASLIDKIPNLGGIARTCEVLGIKNLALHSKALIEKSEFKNLSMTAEKGLNIIEVKASSLIDFLMQKQMEGFKIVGAEQTAKSINFIDFKFPKKSILLLGHEKEGLPANLLQFLDFAVEIPQFGMVRSLNVHVTGSLFMWEYCKQHIVNVAK